MIYAMSTLFIKLWDDYDLHSCVAPEGFENSICGPWLKKFVHHCYRSLLLTVSHSEFVVQLPLIPILVIGGSRESICPKLLPCTSI